MMPQTRERRRMHSEPEPEATLTPLPPTFSLDIRTRTLSLDPRDPVFVQDPYPAYRELLARAPVFHWREYGHWCFARHDDVSARLRDPGFGRQVLHVASRQELARYASRHSSPTSGTRSSSSSRRSTRDSARSSTGPSSSA